MATPLTTAYKRRGSTSPIAASTTSAPRCARDTDLADYPHAVDVRENVLVYSRRRAPSDRRALQAELIRALDRRARRRGVRRRLRRTTSSTAPATRFFAHHRGAARRRLGGGRPLRQARRQRPDLERRAEARAARPRRVRRLLRQRRARRGLARPGSARATRSPRRSTSSIPVATHRFRTATTTSASSRADDLAAYPAHLHRTSPVLTLQGAVAHCDMPLESGPTMLLPLLAAVRRRLHRVQPARVHRVLRRAPRAGAAAQGRRGVLQPRAVSRCRARTSRPTSGGWPTCCRSRRRSAGRWRRWTAPRWCARSTRRCCAMKAAGRPQRELHNVVVATAEGYAVPHQPRPRPADRQPGPASQVDTVLAALADDLTPEQLDVALRDQDERRIP